jgi:hypothetical protein
MKRTDVEHLVRQMAWPEPPASLRARVLSDIPIAEQTIAGAARVAGSQDLARRPQITRESGRSAHAWRRAGVLVGLGFLTMLGSCTGFDVWANRQVEAEIARIEARYGSLDVKTIHVPDVPAADNRARMVRAAAALAVPSMARRYLYPLRAPGPLPAELRAFADDNRAAIRLAGEIRTRRQSNWEVSRSEGAWPPFDAISLLSDAIFVTTLLDLEAGRPDEAASLIVSGLGISASMRQEPDLIAQSHRTFDASRQLEALRRLLTMSAPSKTALKDLAWWLAENRMPDGMRPAMLTEVKWGNAVFERMEHGDVDSDIAANIYPMTWPKWPSAFLGMAAQIGRPFVRTARLRYLQHMERLLDAEMGPRPRMVVREPSVPRWALIDRLRDKVADGGYMFSYVGDGFMSELGVAELAVALRRFKLDHKNYPDDLSALVPVYLTRLPIDPDTGQPPVYARLGAGFTLRAKGSSPGMEKYRALEWNVPK